VLDYVNRHMEGCNILQAGLSLLAACIIDSSGNACSHCYKQFPRLSVIIYNNSSNSLV
jgi:hypothetical protein